MILIIRTFVVAQQVKHSIPLSAIGGSKSVIGNFCFLSTVLKKAKMRNKSPEWPIKITIAMHIIVVYLCGLNFKSKIN